MEINKPVSKSIDDLNNTQISANLAYPGLKSTFKLFFVLLFYMIAGAIILGVFAHEARGGSPPLLWSFLSLSFYVASFFFTIRYASKKIKMQQVATFSINFNKIQVWLVPVVIISTLALFVGLEGISKLIPMPPSVQKFFERAFRKDVFSIINIIIAAPVLEEILWRGIVLKGLLKSYSPLKAILISAIFFSLMHLNPWQAFPAFFGGLFLGWIFYKTQSVISGMIIHATINSIGAVFLFLPKHQQGFLNLLGMPYYVVLCVCSALVFVFGCIVIHRNYPTTLCKNAMDSLINDVVV